MATRGEPVDILLVEDNPGDARLLRELLREGTLPGRLTHVDRLSEARQALADSAFHVILLDLSLPDAHGMETVTSIRAAAPEAPIVVMTGLDDEDVAVQAVQAGAQDYLVKGQVDGPLLSRAIRYALERAQLLKREREARGTAEAAVRARDEVLRIVSHDLGNSLSAVRIQALLLERTPAEQRDDEEVRRRTATIRSLVAGMQRLRQDLLDVASIEAGRLSLDVGTVSVRSLVDEALDLHRDLAAEKSLDLEERIGEDLPVLTADRGRLLQVLANLLGNAIKFTPSGGRIALAARTAGDAVEFEVRDSGPGISEEDCRHIFEAFWRARRGGRQGAGLGLAIARGIVEGHGGRIEVESELGAGSTFRFQIPAGLADGELLAGEGGVDA